MSGLICKSLSESQRYLYHKLLLNKFYLLALLFVYECSIVVFFLNFHYPRLYVIFICLFQDIYWRIKQIKFSDWLLVCVIASKGCQGRDSLPTIFHHNSCMYLLIFLPSPTVTVVVVIFLSKGLHLIESVRIWEQGQKGAMACSSFQLQVSCQNSLARFWITQLPSKIIQEIYLFMCAANATQYVPCLCFVFVVQFIKTFVSLSSTCLK